MWKKLFYPITFGLLWLSPQLISAKELKIGIVDIQYIFNQLIINSTEYKQLEDRKKEVAKEFDTEKKLIQEKEIFFSHNQKKLPQSDADRLYAELELLRLDYLKLVELREKELSQKENALKEPILQRIFNAIDKVRQSLGLDIVLNEDEIVSYDEKLLITKDVLDYINQKEKLGERN